MDPLKTIKWDNPSDEPAKSVILILNMYSTVKYTIYFMHIIKRTNFVFNQKIELLISPWKLEGAI